MSGRKSKKSSKDSRVSAAVEAWNQADRSSRVLGSDARSRILRESMRADGPAEMSLRSLFMPRWAVLLAGLAPVALVTVLLTQVGWGPAGPEDPARIQVAKVGGEVVFTIENGGQPHTVSRSTTPNRFEPESTVAVVDGSFSDRIDGSNHLVFYRID